MFERNELVERADNFIVFLRDETFEKATAQKAARVVLEIVRGSNVQQLDEALTRLAEPLPELAISQAALLAIVCGALVESGASAELVAAPALARFSEAVQLALSFVEACKAEAATTESPAQREPSKFSAQEAVERVGERVSARMPDAAQAFGALNWQSAAALTLLSRSKAGRKRLKSDLPTMQAIVRLAELGVKLPYFHE